MKIFKRFTTEQMMTFGGMVAIIVGIVIWDIFLAVDTIKSNTISGVFLMLGACPAVPLLFGIISGHCFWPKRGMRPKPMEAVHIITMVGSVLGLYLWYNFSNDSVVRFLGENPIAVFAGIGLPMGHFCWPQYAKELK